MNRPTLIAVLALVGLAGCDRLDTRYGQRDSASHSVNGARVLNARLASMGPLTTFSHLSARADHHDLLIHLALMPGSPDEQACAWIRDWLLAAPGRQFVLILRDGNVASWLCARWAAEAEAEAVLAEGSRHNELKVLAERLRTRARQEDEPFAFGLGPPGDCTLFRVRQLRPIPESPLYGLEGPLMHGPSEPPPSLHPERFSGLVTFSTPAMFTLNSSIVAEGGRTLVAADGEAWAMAIPFASSRLVVLANATPLLDGAQVDLRARRLLAALCDELATFKPQRLAWVDSLALRPDCEPRPPNLLAQLFGTPPFSYVAFHLLVLLLAFVAWKAAWLGRVERPADRAVERFARHVEALGFHLRREKAVGTVLTALARALGRSPPPVTRDPARALVLAQILHRSLSAPLAADPQEIP